MPHGPVIVATGPLTSDALSAGIAQYFGQQEYLHFFDAAGPLVTYGSIDMEEAWFASPMTGEMRITSTAPWTGSSMTGFGRR